jgi:uncharacterized damage-inducible protein DinB
MIDLIKTLFEFDIWATRRSIEAIRAAPEQGEKATLLIAHVIASQDIWWQRILGADTTEMDKSPSKNIDECAELAEDLHIQYSAMLESFSDVDLDTVITYRNLSNLEFQSPLCDILLHVAMHGTYHRGQIAKALRESGATPPNTDFIAFTRETSAANNPK